MMSPSETLHAEPHTEWNIQGGGEREREFLFGSDGFDLYGNDFGSNYTPTSPGFFKCFDN